MTMGTKIVFIITLIVSIIVPFGYYLLGEKSRKRYKSHTFYHLVFPRVLLLGSLYIKFICFLELPL